MTLSFIISEIKRDIGRKSRFFHTPWPLHSTHPLGGGGSRRNIAILFGVEKLEWWGDLMVKKLRICSAVSIEYRRVTDRRTDRHLATVYSPLYAYIESRDKNIFVRHVGLNKRVGNKVVIHTKYAQ